MKRFTIIVLFLSVLGGCSLFQKQAEEDIPLARVYDHYLYISDIEGIAPRGISAQDSIEIVKNYIYSWIRQNLMVKIAEKNLTDEEKDFTRQLEDYKNSLITYQYQRKLARQKVDTNVTEQEINNYYEKNQSEFELKENIVKVIYIKLEHNAPNQKLIKKLLKSDDPTERRTLESYCERYAISFSLDESLWLYFNDILKEVPIQTYNQEEYLKNNTFIELKDSLYQYYVSIKDFKIKESVSPLSFERERIRTIIINKRNLDFIHQLENEMYENALKAKKIQIYEQA